MKEKKRLWLALALFVVLAGTASLWAPALGDPVQRAGETGSTPAVEVPPSPTAEATPEPTPTPTPAPEPAEVDLTALERGAVRVRYLAETGGKVKVQLTKDGGASYNFDLDNAGAWERYTLTQGDGDYTLTVLEQVEGTSYRPVFTQGLTLALADPLAPFLEADQFVNYTADCSAAALAAQLTAGCESDAEEVGVLFDYVVDALTYDEEKSAAAGQGELAGYVPDLDAVLDRGQGICFDYAALLCAMCRSVGVPCRLAVGYSGISYHAWVEVWCETAGTIDGAIEVASGDWTLLDPTFVSTQARSESILAYVTDRDNYSVKYVY